MRRAASLGFAGKARATRGALAPGTRAGLTTSDAIENRTTARGALSLGSLHFERQERLMTSRLKLTGVALAAMLAFSAHGQSTTLNDAQIAAIVVTANQVDIDAGKLAESKAHSKEVKDFGKLMVTDHSGVNKAATELVQKLKVTPQDHPIAQSLKRGGSDNLAQLRMLSGAQFDRAYVDHEVAYHQDVLDAMDKTLIPSAKNDEVKALLVKVRPAFVSHLEHARQLQGQLGKSGG
jgi:putative membrane protein